MQYQQKTTDEGSFLASIATEEYKLKNNAFDIIDLRPSRHQKLKDD